MPRNPSEIARLEHELDHWKEYLSRKDIGKMSKEYALRELRVVAKELGISVPDYNSPAFGKFIGSE